MGQTPRSVFQDGSAEVPTSAWGITPPRIKTAGERATAVERGQPETSPNPVELPRRPTAPSSPLGDGWVNSSVPATAYVREGTSQRCRNTPTTFPPDFKRGKNRSPRGPPSRKCTRRATLGLNPRWVQRAVSAVSLRTASRPVELSLQSTLQLSLTVLVRYRTRARI